MEIVTDKYLLDLGFTKGFINKNARKGLGSLRTRPRRFIKSEVDKYLLIRATQRKAIPQKIQEKVNNKAKIIQLFNQVVKEYA